MIEYELKQALSDLPLGGVLFFQQIQSTNDTAKEWAMNGAQDLSLVFAEEQTHGRGRGTRSWITKPGSALAFSIILRIKDGEADYLKKFTALGALAVCETVKSLGLPAKIKWPNDVLLNGRKFCGILAETCWMDATPSYVVLGIGVNAGASSIPDPRDVIFPATSLESESGTNIDRFFLLHQILKKIITWRELIGKKVFVLTWEKYLAFMGEEVIVKGGENGDQAGWVDGLEKDGSLRLRSTDGETISIQVGEIHLRPLV